MYARKEFRLGSQLSRKLSGMQRFLRWSFSHSIRSQHFGMRPAQALEEYWIERLLGAKAVMPDAQKLAHLLEQFGLAQSRLDR